MTQNKLVYKKHENFFSSELLLGMVTCATQEIVLLSEHLLHTVYSTYDTLPFYYVLLPMYMYNNSQVKYACKHVQATYQQIINNNMLVCKTLSSNSVCVCVFGISIYSKV